MGKIIEKSKKIVHKIRENNEKSARSKVIEDLFYDFNRSRVQIYKMNFFRGIFFGLGSVLGGTIVVAVLVWTLSIFVEIPGIGDSFKQVKQTIESAK
ncbi:MAG: DUF5665 domain-containing protein [Candidatus Saccharimonadales bacterium]